MSTPFYVWLGVTAVLGAAIYPLCSLTDNYLPTPGTKYANAGRLLRGITLIWLSTLTVLTFLIAFIMTCAQIH